jgi:hypothetical protein
MATTKKQKRGAEAKKPGKAATALGGVVPPDWDEHTSFRQWFPDEAIRAKVRAGLTAARKKTGAPRKKALTALAPLFPAALLALVEDDIATGVNSVDDIPSPQVT